MRPWRWHSTPRRASVLCRYRQRRLVRPWRQEEQAKRPPLVSSALLSIDQVQLEIMAFPVDNHRPAKLVEWYTIPVEGQLRPRIIDVNRCRVFGDFLYLVRWWDGTNEFEIG